MSSKLDQGATRASAAGVVAPLAIAASPALAQDFTHDGYSSDGGYQLNVELMPFGFLPHAEASASGLGPRGRVGISRSVGAWQIVQSLNGAFFGDGIVRYGPYSAVLEIDWIHLSQGKEIPLPRLGAPVHLSGSASAVLVSPGIGYQICRGSIALAPISVDAGVQLLLLERLREYRSQRAGWRRRRQRQGFAMGRNAS